jgi:hypothetical protein
MNFVTPKKRQEWLGQAEDYADIVKKIFFLIEHFIHSFFYFTFSVYPTNEIYFTTFSTIMFSINIY